jgi:hypothetical protein
VATGHLYAPCDLSVDRIETDGTGLLLFSHFGAYVIPRILFNFFCDLASSYSYLCLS